MSTIKIGEVPSPCLSPSHNPPSMMVYPPGVYEHTCPACGHKTTFAVNQTDMLKRDGKPMRALRALADTSETWPMTERGVGLRAVGNRAARRAIPSYWAALATLVDHGLAERSGVRGEYMWHITREGLELLTVEDETCPSD